jgi:predicted ribosomally synthesized peptide with nif11-like leader
MSKQQVENLLEAGGSDKHLRLRYDQVETKEDFVALANAEGYDFTIPELDEVLKESGDDFESFGNPRKRAIWWY